MESHNDEILKLVEKVLSILPEGDCSECEMDGSREDTCQGYRDMKYRKGAYCQKELDLAKQILSENNLALIVEKEFLGSIGKDSGGYYLQCSDCGKKVSNYVSSDIILRGGAYCPECDYVRASVIPLAEELKE